jgi:S-adenosylmethionine/arginine decarboxylase-like enzyme
VLLAESHLAVHTWPEISGVTIDAYVCNFSDDNSQRAQQLLNQLIAAFAPVRIARQQLQRASPA